jgi:hypothetical protein
MHHSRQTNRRSNFRGKAAPVHILECEQCCDAIVDAFVTAVLAHKHTVFTSTTASHAAK